MHYLDNIFTLVKTLDCSKKNSVVNSVNAEIIGYFDMREIYGMRENALVYVA